MDEKTSRHFAEIIDLAESVFQKVVYEIDSTPDRSILRINADYEKYEILVTELISAGKRKYRYYVIKEDWVEAGFDNAPDPRAIKLKYGKIGKEHTGENIPHLHTENKTKLQITEEMAFTDFVEWLKSNL